MTAPGDWGGADGLDEVPGEEAGPALPRYPARQATKAPATAAISTTATATAILPPRRGGRRGGVAGRGCGGGTGRCSAGGTGRGSGTGTRRGSGLAGGNGTGVVLVGMEAPGVAARPAAACAVSVGRFASKVASRPAPRGATAGCVRVADSAVLSSARS